MEPQIDPRLEMLMQWLKDNDETDLPSREDANPNNNWVPELVEDTGYD